MIRGVAMPSILKLLQDNDIKVRSTAAFVLGRLVSHGE